MNLRKISYGLRAAGDVARAGETLLGSLDRSRAGGALPLLVGMVLGAAVGALLLRDDLRKQVLAWAGLSSVTASRGANGAPVEPRATVTS